MTCVNYSGECFLRRVTECMNAQFFHLKTWVFQNTLGFSQVQGLPILGTTLSILADEVWATVHPNPVPPAMLFVSTPWT